MSRINTNVQSLIAQRVLGQNNQGLNASLERLATGLRINRGKDDPSGLIASENLRAEQAGLSSALKNAERADQVVNIAEGGLNEVNGLLTELQGLVTASANTAGLSAEEKEANQLQIDSILQTIDRIAGATSFQGTKLLNGNFDFSVSGVGSEVNSFNVNGAKLEFEGTRDVEVVVTQSAQRAGLFLSAGGALDLGGATSTFVIEITGSKGSREFSFASGTALATVADTINSFKDVLGISADVSGTGVRLDSIEFGSDEFVSVKVVNTGNIAGANVGIYQYNTTDTSTANTTILSTYANASTKVTDEGQDVGATINGLVATTKGTTARVNSDFLDVQLDITDNDAQTLTNFTAFTITGGGAEFQLAGQVDIAGKVALGIQNVAARELGRVEDGGTDYNLQDLGAGKGLNLVDGDLSVAQKVISEAIKNVSQLRGRLGAFQANTVGATVRSLGIALENTAAAESVIRDADFATETASLTRSQILAASAQNTLQQANFQPQSVLQLLG
ncbi:MAG: flagellin [Phycisphaeraceae bacterium]|nr:flagellin [Phycisphaerales bacterium]MCB9843081.1 flagellin [Phycisphaeraceae bacterium]